MPFDARSAEFVKDYATVAPAADCKGCGWCRRLRLMVMIWKSAVDAIAASMTACPTIGRGIGK